MHSRMLWVAVFVSVSISAVLAQDPTKVDPKHYKLAFENEEVQVLYIFYGPHEKSPIHDHLGGVVVSVTNGHLRFTDDHGKTQTVSQSKGEARYFPPFKHMVENISDEPYRAVYIGLRNRHAAQAAGGDKDQAAAQLASILEKYVSAARSGAKVNGGAEGNWF